MPAGAEQPARTFGDARVVFYATEREARDRTVTKDEGVRLRLRAGAEKRLSEEWLLRARFAGRYATGQDRMRLWVKGWAPTRTGIEDGDTTVDEFFVNYSPRGADWSLRAGRFQTKFALADITEKSLDRKDTSNVTIGWTDGLHWRYQLTPEWRANVLLQHNNRRGTGNTWRAPLDFSDSASRVSYFGGLEATRPWGPLKQRMIGVTWIPSGLASQGLGDARREDYLALTARSTGEWPIGESGMRGVIGLEFGYAPNTPSREVMGAGEGDSGGLAKTFSMNLMDFMPRHDLGFAYGSLDPGWLISPSYRANELLQEIRYRWRIDDSLTLEARLRRREERHLPADVTRPRIDDDAYLRFTFRF